MRGYWILRYAQDDGERAQDDRGEEVAEILVSSTRMTLLYIFARMITRDNQRLPFFLLLYPILIILRGATGRDLLRCFS